MKIEKGDKVRAHYAGRLDNGTEFDSSYKRGNPIEFQAGVGQMIPGFDNAVIGMGVGEKKTVTVGPEEAYGEHNPEGIVMVTKESFPPDFTPEPETVIQGRNDKDEPITALVIEIRENGDAILDLNHPLAGESLTFDIEILDVQK